MFLFVKHTCLEPPGGDNGEERWKSRSIPKYIDNKPVDRVSIGQIQADQSVWVPQISEKITSARIWYSQLKVHHYNYLTYVHQTISTIQEEILAGKEAFGRWVTTFGVKIHSYHADNRRFSEQPFRSAIEEFNQTIIFLGSGSYHQNSIVERKFQTLTLGARIFLLHAKIFPSESITTISWPYEIKFLYNN